MREKIKKVLKYITLPFIILASFIIGYLHKNTENDKELRDKIEDVKNEIKGLEKETAKVSKNFEEKEKALSKSISNSEKVLDEIKASKQQRDKEAEKFFKK